ncbi:aldose 1-epimerase [Apostasia shenzhenica]|uniref:Aldose 1-epimerase n=1 Tax=Apostasia shenzhenica TaxID=1088818 RepID=A0A2I0BFM8_9ASPA|nr:aldose 1-epimerase [Apostasia shenzhenica]
MRKFAVVKDEKTGRAMELWANRPAMAFCTLLDLEHVKGRLCWKVVSTILSNVMQ